VDDISHTTSALCQLFVVLFRGHINARMRRMPHGLDGLSRAGQKGKARGMLQNGTPAVTELGIGRPPVRRLTAAAHKCSNDKKQ
jgi:hypothetical protein